MKLQSINPHNQLIIGELNVSTNRDVSKAVTKAKKAFTTWKNVPINKRCDYIKQLIKILQNNKHALAKVVSREMGKPLTQSVWEIDSELRFIKYYAENGAKILSDEKIHNKYKNLYKITYEPYGVCACICPWNFPLSMISSGVLPALIAGNTIVVKPSEYSSLSQSFIVKLINQTGLPEGVVNLIIGGSETGKALLNEEIDLVWFTGSTKTGLEIYKKCGEKFIKSILEMGGSSAGIVMADANLDNAVENIYWARFLNCGQVCTAIKRLFVERPIFDLFLKKLLERIQKSKIGNPLEKVDFGPLVNRKQLDLIKKQMANAIKKGACVEFGGKQPREQKLKNGNYYEPTILTNVNLDMKILKEETFGPILPILPFESEDEAIYLANETCYGLSTEIYTSDYKRGERMAKRIESGTVSINTNDFFHPEIPFGGWKQSGINQEYGKIGMRQFAKIKVILIHKI